MAVCIGRLTNADFSCPYSVFTSRGVHCANGCGVDDLDLLADSAGAETERPEESSPGSCGGIGLVAAIMIGVYTPAVRAELLR